MYCNENDIIKAVKPAGGYKISLKSFFALAFTISWIGVIPIVGGSWITDDSPMWLVDLVKTLAPLQLLMFFGTLIAAFIAILLNYGTAGLKALGASLIKIRAPWYAYGAIIFGPAAISYFSLSLSRIIDPAVVIVGLDTSLLVNFAQILLIQLILNTEEIAWRGYALPQMQANLSPFKANLYLAIIWGLFHLPLFMMAGGHPGGYPAVLFIIMIVPMGMVFGYSFNKLGGSIILVHLLHQSFNAWGEAFRVYPVLNNGSQWPMIFTVAFVVIIGFLTGSYLFKLRI